jgi:hypothetical protein
MTSLIKIICYDFCYDNRKQSDTQIMKTIVY